MEAQPMSSRDLYNILHRKPFAPFRVFVKDGRSFDVRQETHAIVGDEVFLVGIPSLEVPGWVPHCAEHIDLDLIDRVEELTTPTTAS
jgi:hypothetical protein